MLACLIAISLLRCTGPSPSPYRYHEIKGFAALYSAVPVLHTAISGADSGKWSPVPIRLHEVMLALGDESPYLLRGTKDLPDSLIFQQADSLVFLNGKLYGLVINDSYDLLPFFSQVRHADLHNLKSITVSGPIPESYLPWLDSISRVTSDVDFYLEGDSLDIPASQIDWIAKHFDPHFLGLEIHARDFPLLAEFKHLQSLYLMSVGDTLEHQPGQLPAIPSLRYLSISMDASLNDVGDHFLDRNPQLISLSTSMDYSGFDLAGQLPKGLKSLYLYTSDSIRWLPKPEDLPKLSAISINQPLSDSIPLQALRAFAGVRELGLPAGMQQREFDSLIPSFTRLRSMFILFDDTLLVTDYRKLAELKQLKHLVITGKHGSVSALKNLKQLDYLSLPEEFFEDTVALASLRQALPETRIAPNSGFCMGTGWILLGIPALFLSLLFWRLWRTKTSSTDIPSMS